MPDAGLEGPQGAALGIATLRKHQDDASPIQNLVNRPQPCLVKLSAARRDREDADQRQQPTLPGAIEHGLPLGHRVYDRRLRKERDDEGRVKPRLVIGGDDVRRRGDVFEPGHRDPEEMKHEPAHDAPDHAVEPWRFLGVGVD